MKRGKRIPRKKSRRLFTKTASRTNRKNIPTGRPMRGGIRL